MDFIHNHADQTLLIDFAFERISPPFRCKFRHWRKVNKFHVFSLIFLWPPKGNFNLVDVCLRVSHVVAGANERRLYSKANSLLIFLVLCFFGCHFLDHGGVQPESSANLATIHIQISFSYGSKFLTFYYFHLL